MLRSHSYLHASRQPTDSVQDGWLSHIRTHFSPKPEREHGASMPMGAARPHTADGMVRSDWFMVGTRDVVTACRNVLSRSRRVLSYTWNVFHGVSDGPSTVPPQTLRNTAETRRKPFWKAFSRVISQVCLRIGENARSGNPSNTTVQNALNPTLERAESLSSCDWA